MHSSCESTKETFSKPYDIKCGFVVSSSKGKHMVFPTEEEAWEYVEQQEKEREELA